MINDNFELINEDCRKPHGYYDIDPMMTHIYPFSIEVDNPLVISIVLRNIDKQDEALCCWFSEDPLEYSVFPLLHYVSPFAVLRGVTNFTFYDSSCKNKLLTLQPDKTYYMNIKNKQNAQNQYGLSFDYLKAIRFENPSPFY